MSHDVVPENNVQEIEIEGPRQDGCNIASRQDNSKPKSVNSDPKSKENLIKGVECSVRSDDRFTVRFVNTTDKSVDVIWLNFEGHPVTYETLQPQTAWTVFTYKTHPWIFRDSINQNERLVVKKNKFKSAFFECDDFLNDLKQSTEYEHVVNGHVPICVLLQLPVEDLRQLALKTVRRHIRRKEDCFCLNILPQQIQFEIADMFI